MTTETITAVELDLIHFIERFHSSQGYAPSDAQINQRFTGLTPDFMQEFKTNPLILKSFAVRGILYPNAEDRFTPEQMHAAATMLDLVDRRSDEKKLRDLGITTRQWSAWLQDDNFASYLRDRSEKLIANSQHELHKGLMKGVRQGNIASVKLAYELTGRHDPTKDTQIDLQRVLHTFIEILQKYIKDPITLHSIATELMNTASAESFSTGLANQMTNGPRPQLIQGSAVSNLPTPPPLEGLND